MRRAGFTLVFLAAAGGCLSTNPFRVGDPPTDKDRELVPAAITAVAPAAFKSFALGQDWDARSTTHSHVQSGGEHTLRWDFAGQLSESAAPGKTLLRLTADARRRVLDGMQAEFLTAVRATGVEVTTAQPAAAVPGADGEFSTHIRYLRNKRTVAGEVIGHIRSCPEREPFTEMTFTLQEYWCK